MLAFVRAACAAALVLLLSIPAIAADKSFRRDDLTDAAIKLEAQIKGEAGQVSKPAAALRREVDAAFQRNDSPAAAINSLPWPQATESPPFITTASSPLLAV